MPSSNAVAETRAPIYSRTADDLPHGEDPPASPGGGASTSAAVPFSDDWLLARARSIHKTSTDYLEMNVTSTWQRSVAHFRGEHAPGTNYSNKDFKRSRTFRPKTRSTIKGHEAGLAAAVFSTPQVADITPWDETDPSAVLSAAITKSIMQYRLKHTVPWFLTVLGAFQDTKVYGLCSSHQYWDYRVAEDVVPELDEFSQPVTQADPETGELQAMGRAQKRVVADRPCVDLIEPENLRFDPMCDWRNPAQTSPYIEWIRPMYAGDVLQMMQHPDPQKAWRQYDLGQVLSSRTMMLDRTRQAREGRNRTDPAQQQQAGDELTTVWAHMFVMRHEDVDYCWWMLGTEMVLTDAKPLQELYPHLAAGERPFVVGYSSIEAHRNYPDGDAAQGASMQVELNDIANQRLDNVKLVLNKRYFIRRGSQTDLDALMRNVPGGGVMVNDPEKDVMVINTPDVTGSSYQEQDRLATEFDELTGAFSQSSVLSNRKLNETVGGMDNIRSSAGSVQDYGLTIFFQTWLEPVLQQVQKLIRAYETDEVVLGIAAKRTDLWKRYGLDKVTDDLFRHDLVVQVNVAVGNTDPVRRVERLMAAVEKTAALPGIAERIKSINVADEVYGALGFRGSQRFVMSDEEMAAHQQQNGPPPPPPEIELKKMELDIRKEDNGLRDAREKAKLELQREIEYAKLALQEKITMEELATRLGTEQMKNKTLRDTTALKEANRLSEMNLKQATGSGI
jgi:hypothetical protein